MNETGLLIAGAGVSIVVFTGGFLYAMLTFVRLGDRDDAKTASPK